VSRVASENCSLAIERFPCAIAMHRVDFELGFSLTTEYPWLLHARRERSRGNSAACIVMNSRRLNRLKCICQPSQGLRGIIAD